MKKIYNLIESDGNGNCTEITWAHASSYEKAVEILNPPEPEYYRAGGTDDFPAWRCTSWYVEEDED